MEKAKLKDHEIRELTNELRDCSKKYNHTQQLRSRISTVLRKYIESKDRNENVQVD